MASVLVDDTSSDILYLGPWQATGSQGYVGQGIFGNPHRSTLHRLQGSEGSFSYVFTGAPQLKPPFLTVMVF